MVEDEDTVEGLPSSGKNRFPVAVYFNLKFNNGLVFSKVDMSNEVSGRSYTPPFPLDNERILNSLNNLHVFYTKGKSIVILSQYILSFCLI